MPYNQDNASLEEIDAATTRELHLLCTSLYDELITEEGMIRLNSLLTESSAARQVYLSYVTLHSRLLASTGKDRQARAEALRHHLTTVVNEGGEEGLNELFATEVATNTQSDLSKLGSARSDRGSPLVWAVAASLLVSTSIWLSWTAKSTNRTSDLAQTGNQAEAIAAESRAANERISVARLSYVSHSTRWTEFAEDFHQLAAVQVGSKLSLAEGEVELTYDTGTKLLLIGPAEFLVNSTGGKLRRGGLVASVTDAGHGFTIETPNGKVVDLGTEFGVAVDDFGLSEVSVFQGKVEAFPQGKRNPNEKFELTKGHGLQWSQKDLIPLDADLRRFATSIVDLGKNSDSEISLVDQFREKSLRLEEWKSFGAVETSPVGLKLIGGDSPSKRPYLISADQFDPAQGAITVTCDFYFADAISAESASLSILTRSADHRGTAPAPWDGALASCLRCSFGTSLDSHKGVLQSAVKMESDRESTSIAGSKVLPPSSQTPYRIVMRDDGVNVSLSVSQRDDPKTEKSITFRSLFRGKSNFIALEGSPAGTIIVDRIKISQELSPSPLASYADFSSMLLKNNEQRDLVNQLLDKWTPVQANQVLRDDFEAEKLDVATWEILEDVRLVNGAVRLGSPNAEGHIDTWKSRPYLLTRQALDPKAGELTILGSISFAENFLTGYGASFSVMTRADGKHGQGPGWENSVLRRGLRANFWPAAWDSEHSLELHEKPAANTITLLATQGMRVDPRMRSYLFRVIDDGQSISLTILNPLRSEETMTISSSTSSTIKQGVIGFESCWGSPVTLDNLRIYQGRNRKPTTTSPLLDE